MTITRGYTILSQPIDHLYNKVIESCKELKVSDLRGDPASGEIGGEKGAYFIINIGSVLSGTLVEVVTFRKIRS